MRDLSDLRASAAETASIVVDLCRQDIHELQQHYLFVTGAYIMGQGSKPVYITYLTYKLS